MRHTFTYASIDELTLSLSHMHSSLSFLDDGESKAKKVKRKWNLCTAVSEPIIHYTLLYSRLLWIFYLCLLSVPYHFVAYAMHIVQFSLHNSLPAIRHTHTACSLSIKFERIVRCSTLTAPRWTTYDSMLWPKIHSTESIDAFLTFTLYFLLFPLCYHVRWYTVLMGMVGFVYWLLLSLS